MKRERERQFYYIYGNLAERFANAFRATSIEAMPRLIFHTNYPLTTDKHALKPKHYQRLLTNVVNDYFVQDLTKRFEVIINAIVPDELPNEIHLCFEAILIKTKKDEFLNVIESSPEQRT